MEKCLLCYELIRTANAEGSLVGEPEPMDYPNILLLAEHIRRRHPTAATVMAQVLEFVRLSDGGQGDVLNRLR